MRTTIENYGFPETSYRLRNEDFSPAAGIFPLRFLFGKEPLKIALVKKKQMLEN